MASKSKTPGSPLSLTPKQLRVLQLVDHDRRTKGYSPTMQELADQLGISKVTVFEHIEALIAKGALMRDANKARSLTLSPEVALPMMEEDVPSRQIDSDIERRKWRVERPTAHRRL